ALWDLKAKLLDVPLADALPRFHASIPVYGSGGFTDYSTDRLAEQLPRWVAGGIGSEKMKVGRDPAADAERVRAAREASGWRIEQLLFGGAQSPEGGRLAPDPDRPGLGLELKRHEAAQFAI